MIINADHTYIQSGRPKNGEISGVIYFITRPKIKRRKVWLIDYAACAFKTYNGKLLLVEGFCFLGTDGAPELEPVETSKAEVPEGRR